MERIRLRPASAGLLASLLCSATICVFCVVIIRSSASQDIKVLNQPASEGRPITPTGVLVMDAGTKAPAVAPLTVDFVRSPDKNGPDGQGRYLIAVNSGFG